MELHGRATVCAAGHESLTSGQRDRLFSLYWWFVRPPGYLFLYATAAWRKAFQPLGISQAQSDSPLPLAAVGRPVPYPAERKKLGLGELCPLQLLARMPGRVPPWPAVHSVPWSRGVRVTPGELCLERKDVFVTKALDWDLGDPRSSTGSLCDLE